MPQKKVAKKKSVKKKQLPTKLGHETVKAHFIEMMLPKLINIATAWMEKNGKAVQEYQQLRGKKAEKKKDEKPTLTEADKKKRGKIVAILKKSFGCHRDAARALVNELTNFNIRGREIGESERSYKHESTVLKKFELRNGLIIKIRGRKGALIVANHDDYDEDYDLHNNGGHVMYARPGKEQLDIESVVTDPKEIEAFLKTMKPNTMMNIMRGISNFNL